MLWTEPSGEKAVDKSSNFSFRGNYGETLFSKIRHFVVIEQFENHCLAL